MTSRERVEAALNHREPDRTPIFEYVLQSPVADLLLGRPYALTPATWAGLLEEKGWEQAVRQMAVDQLDLAMLLGHDMLYVVPNPPPPAPPQHAGPFPPGPSPDSDDPVDRMRVRNQAAAQAPGICQDTLLVYTLMQDEMHRRGVDLPILAPCYAHGVWTDVDLLQTLLLAPGVAREHFALATRASLERTDLYAALGLDLIGIGGDFSGNRPMISPHAYREFIVPEVRALSRRIHAHGCHAVNASDGDLWPVLDDFLFGCEVDAYLEIDLHAGMDMARLKQACGTRITLMGNLDCGTTLSFGSSAEIQAHVESCIEAGMGSGGHILCASNAITASVSLANYVAVVNAYRERFSLPRLSPGAAA